MSQDVFLSQEPNDFTEKLIGLYSSEDLTWTHSYPEEPWSIIQWVAEWGYNAIMNPNLLKLKTQVIDTIVTDMILQQEITYHVPECCARIIRNFLNATAGNIPNEANLQPPPNLDSMQLYWRRAFEMDVNTKLKETILRLHVESVKRYRDTQQQKTAPSTILNTKTQVQCPVDITTEQETQIVLHFLEQT